MCPLAHQALASHTASHRTLLDVASEEVHDLALGVERAALAELRAQHNDGTVRNGRHRLGSDVVPQQRVPNILRRVQCVGGRRRASTEAGRQSRARGGQSHKGRGTLTHVHPSAGMQGKIIVN